MEQEHGRWKGFRKGLSKEDQEAFDRLFDRAKFHTAAGVYMAHPYPLETILVSIIRGYEKMLGEIRENLNEGNTSERKGSEYPLLLFLLKPDDEFSTLFPKR